MAKHRSFKKKEKNKKEVKNKQHREHVKPKKNQFWMWTSIILAIVILFGIYKMYISTGTNVKTNGEDIKTIAESTVQYINSQMLQGKATAKLVSYNTTDYPGLYYIKIEINGQQYESYVTSDGKLLFPSGIPIEKTNENNKPENNQPKESKFDAPNTEKPNVKLFVMAFCPFGLQSEKAMIPVYNLLKDKADFELHYVIYSHYGNESECVGNGSYCSMHGLAEVNEDIRQLCIKEIYGKDKLWKYLDYFDHECTYDNKETCWEEAANKSGINITKITECLNEEKTAGGETRLKPEKEIGDKYSVRGSPTLFINGKSYSGTRSPESYKEAICSGFTNPPEECNQKLSNNATSTGFGGGTSSGSGGNC